ncbi:hypothetical protein WA026_006759 [Henosepilachna vigintioctopunctata]|uniref:Uncharacterized protein n=1 Tax=Henosepilachna vigintioctopunctata TaxID=420089 RepID=A0AAW1UGA1_9CUCU
MVKQETRTDKLNESQIVRKRKAIRTISDSSCDGCGGLVTVEVPMALCDTSERENEDKEEDNCRGCGENYYKTALVEHWLQYNICMLWTHENCTPYEDM